MCNDRISPNTVAFGIFLVVFIGVSYISLQRSNELENIRRKGFVMAAESCRKFGKNEVALADTFNYCLKRTRDQLYCADILRNKIDAIAYSCLVSELKEEI